MVDTLKLQDSLQGFNAAHTIDETVLSKELQHLQGRGREDKQKVGIKIILPFYRNVI
jgi:hypothetical protein